MQSKSKLFPALLLLLIGVGTMACKKDADAKAAETKEAQDDALKQLEKSLEGLKGGNSEVVDFRILKDALPEKIAGMNRVSHNGSKTGFAGLIISTAEATYEDGDKKMKITIVDSGGLGAVLAGMAAWSQVEMDNESDQGYERTTMIDGKKAIEKYNRTTKTGEISVISADRFIVSVTGNNIEEEDLRKAVSKINIKG